MTINEELSLLEDAYSAIMTKGVKSYRIGDRELTRLDLPFITSRMDQLRAASYRQSNGMMQAARNRMPE
jgi:hypothetical protein